MTVWYTIYTRSEPPCNSCRLAKELLQVEGKDYYEIDLEEAGVREFFHEKGLRTVPQVFREGKHIGGYLALQEHIKEEHIVKKEEYLRKAGHTPNP